MQQKENAIAQNTLTVSAIRLYETQRKTQVGHVLWGLAGLSVHILCQCNPSFEIRGHQPLTKQVAYWTHIKVGKTSLQDKENIEYSGDRYTDSNNCCHHRLVHRGHFNHSMRLEPDSYEDIHILCIFRTDKIPFRKLFEKTDNNHVKEQFCILILWLFDK